MFKHIVVKSARASIWNKREISDDVSTTLKEIVKWKMKRMEDFKPGLIIDEFETIFEDVVDLMHKMSIDAVEKPVIKLGVEQ